MTAGPTADLRTVRVEGLSTPLVLELRRHTDEVVHELKILGAGITSGVLDAEVPARLAGLIEAINERYASARLVSERQIAEAAERGDATVTVEMVLPTEAAPAVAEYAELLDQADDYCRAGHLLALAPRPEVVELRRRILGEIAAQLR